MRVLPWHRSCSQTNLGEVVSTRHETVFCTRGLSQPAKNAELVSAGSLLPTCQRRHNLTTLKHKTPREKCSWLPNLTIREGGNSDTSYICLRVPNDSISVVKCCVYFILRYFFQIPVKCGPHISTSDGLLGQINSGNSSPEFQFLTVAVAAESNRGVQ